MRLGLALASLMLFLAPSDALRKQRPNILFVLADDLGWGDLSWSQSPDLYTPKLDELRKAGIEFTQFYTQPKCTAARAALMTGRYPYKMGVQSDQVFSRALNNTLNPKYKLLPQYLKDLGYQNHIVGKWHLGDCNVNATPIRRGFDTHFGPQANLDDRFNLTKGGAFDWAWNNEPYWQGQGTYSASLITNHTQTLLTNHFTNKTTKSKPLFLYVSYLVPHAPLQVPKRYITGTPCRNIPKMIKHNTTHNINNKRRTYCGMVAAMDEGIGNIIQTMKDLRVNNKFIIIFTSDNGGAVKHASSNFPLRGNKQTVYEGGTRVRTLFHAPRYLPAGNRKGQYDGLIHITDMLPTLLEAVRGNLSLLPKDIDGMSAWTAIKRRKPTNRQWMVYNIDSARQLGGLRFKNRTHNFKLIFNNDSTSYETGFRYPDRRPEAEQNNETRKQVYRKNGKAYFFYNLDTNPNELPPVTNKIKYPDAAKTHVAMFTAMKNKLTEFTNEEVERPFYIRMRTGQKIRRRGGAWRPVGC